MFGGAGLVALLIIGFGAVPGDQEGDTSRAGRSAPPAIPGIHNYLKTNPDWFVVPAEGNHKAGRAHVPDQPAGRRHPQPALAELHG